jgi:hypothetical protein
MIRLVRSTYSKTRNFGLELRDAAIELFDDGLYRARLPQVNTSSLQLHDGIVIAAGFQHRQVSGDGFAS